MRRIAIVIAAVALGGVCLAGCGGSQEVEGRPATVDDLSKWMAAANGCDVGVTESRTPADGESAWAIKRFKDEASVGASITCETWLSGWISYYKFPSAEGREAAVQERAPLRRNQLYCAKGRELIVNELLGHDYAADFCRRLGFSIHHPTKRTRITHNG
jgi:hypothetical protein